MATGTWGIGNFKLPDFGITEMFSKPTGSTQASTFYNPAAVSTPSGLFDVKQNPLVNYDPYTSSSPSGGTGQVMGASISGGSFQPQGMQSGQPQQPQQQQQESYQDQARNRIGGMWDNYMGQLNNMLGQDLPQYQNSLTQNANQSAELATQQAGTQKGSSERQVNEQQKSSLKDLSGNMRNLFQAGNIYLGSRGASDSSAANQYAFALTKEGSKARAGILAEANSRINNIKDIYDTEVNRIQTDLTGRLGEISDWFYSAQQNLKGSLASAGLNKEKDLQSLSENLYNQAVGYLSQIQQEASGKKQALEQWAINNSKSTQELIANLKQVEQMTPFQGMQNGMPTVDAQGNFRLPMTGYGTNNEKDKLFG